LVELVVFLVTAFLKKAASRFRCAFDFWVFIFFFG